jgi:hypothetical protein
MEPVVAEGSRAAMVAVHSETAPLRGQLALLR